jgi:hypothetical protein
VGSGALAALNSKRRLRGTGLLAVQVGVLGAGAVALAATGRVVLGVVFAAVVVVDTVLLHVWQGEPMP